MSQVILSLLLALTAVVCQEREEDEHDGRGDGRGDERTDGGFNPLMIKDKIVDLIEVEKAAKNFVINEIIKKVGKKIGVKSEKINNIKTFIGDKINNKFTKKTEKINNIKSFVGNIIKYILL